VRSAPDVPSPVSYCIPPHTQWSLAALLGILIVIDGLRHIVFMLSGPTALQCKVVMILMSIIDLDLDVRFE